jgi:hypothetical protein
LSHNVNLGMTRFHNVGSLLQPVPQAREIRIPLQ